MNRPVRRPEVRLKKGDLVWWPDRHSGPPKLRRVAFIRDGRAHVLSLEGLNGYSFSLRFPRELTKASLAEEIVYEADLRNPEAR